MKGKITKNIGTYLIGYYQGMQYSCLLVSTKDMAEFMDDINKNWKEIKNNIKHKVCEELISEIKKEK